MRFKYDSLGYEWKDLFRTMRLHTWCRGDSCFSDILMFAPPLADGLGLDMSVPQSGNGNSVFRLNNDCPWKKKNSSYWHLVTKRDACKTSWLRLQLNEQMLTRTTRRTVIVGIKRCIFPIKAKNGMYAPRFPHLCPTDTHLKIIYQRQHSVGYSNMSWGAFRIEITLAQAILL